MKKYKLYKTNDLMPLETCSTKQKASARMMEYIREHNEGLEEGDEGYLTPFDFTLEELECVEINEVVTTYEEAREYLGETPNEEFTIIRTALPDNPLKDKDVDTLVSELNPNNIKALIAFNRLCTIAQAWNKADGFKPDFGDKDQDKYFPWFEYSDYSARFALTAVSITAPCAHSYLGSRLCFGTRKRAEQFGQQFIDLWNEVLLVK